MAAGEQGTGKNPQNRLVTVCGLHGQGKTYYSKEIIKQNDLKYAVLSPHYHDWASESEKHFVYIDEPHEKKTLDRLWSVLKEMCKKGVIDGVLIDEADVLFANNKVLTSKDIDAFGSHRHYNMGIMLLTRQPQHIAQYIYGSSAYIVSFLQTSPNAVRKLNQIIKGFGDRTQDLMPKSYKYVFYESGTKEIKVCEPI